VAIEAPAGRYGNERHGMAFQREPYWVRPVWPAVPGQQQMTMHLDIGVDDLEAAVAWALELEATQAAFQPQAHVRVVLDPAAIPSVSVKRKAKPTAHVDRQEKGANGWA
jgi:hypothetical protein